MSRTNMDCAVVAAAAVASAAAASRRAGAAVIAESLEPRRLLSAAFQEAGVPDVVSQFVELKRNPDALGFRLRPETPEATIFDHYQGMARFPGDGVGVMPLFYVSQLDKDADRGGGWLHVVQMGSRGQTGERLRSNRTPGGQPQTKHTPPPIPDSVVRTFHFNGGSIVVDGTVLPLYKHPGGVTVYDNILFVPVDQVIGQGPVGQIVMFDLGSQGESRDNPVRSRWTTWSTTSPSRAWPTAGS